MTIRVKDFGQAAHPFILRLLEHVGGAKAEVVTSGHSDILLIGPYFFSTAVMRRLFLFGMNRASSKLKLKEKFRRALLRLILQGGTRGPVLAVTVENLDVFPWDAWGETLLELDIPRLGYWPTEIDPLSFRAPYWWYWVDWPELRKSKKNMVTPNLFPLDVLQEPLSREGFYRRKDEAILITRNLRFPRSHVVHELSATKQIRIEANSKPSEKINLISDYRYYVSTENSLGYGYETEKVPQAWWAGCVPIGNLVPPYSDFHRECLPFGFDESQIENCFRLPLLKTTPRLEGAFEYLGRYI